VPGADNRFSPSGSLGIYVAGRQLTITQVSWSLRGLVPTAMESIQAEPGAVGAALADWLKAHFKPKHHNRLRVCIGLSAQQTYFTTRCVEDSVQEPVPAQAMLAGSSAGSVWEADQVAADTRLVRLGPGQNACSVAACRKELAAEIYEALSGLDLRSYRLEPAPWSLLRAADRQSQAPRGWKAAVRVFVGPAQALAMLTCEDQAVLWRPFACGPAGRHLSITSAVRSLLAHARGSLGIREVSGIFLQGQIEPDLAERVQEQSGLETLAGKNRDSSLFPPGNPSNSDHQEEGNRELSLFSLFSLALALSARRHDPEAMDLLASLRPPPSIREIFPRRLAVCILLLTALMGSLLWDRWSSLQRDGDVVRRQNLSRAWATQQSFGQIDQQRKALSAEVGAVHKFLSTRVLWSDYLRDLPTRLPPNACLSNIWGFCELRDGSAKDKRKLNKSLTLRCQSRFADRYSAPREIDSFLEGLGGVELLQRDFPLVKLADIKWRREMDSEIAQFTIIALPREKDLAPSKDAKEDKE